MLKTTTTVKAKDTSSAMEKVITELGEDCVILSTKRLTSYCSFQNLVLEYDDIINNSYAFAERFICK